MLPVKSNTTSKACGEAIGSNCVQWTGGQLCSADLCKGNTTLTDVITAMDNKICGGDVTSPCYTGNWVDFFSSIPGSGSSTGVSWITSTPGNPFGSGTGTENSPQYKWTKDGDLKVRGSFRISVAPTVTGAFFKIPLTTISSSCFPANFNASQSSIIGVDSYHNDAAITIVLRAFLTLDYPSGILYYNCSFNDVYTLNFDVVAYMGGTTFNLA